LRAGEEFVFEIDEEPYATPGLTLSALIVCPKGARYELSFFDGLIGETYQ
jgi:hypothetical protein